MVRQKAVSKAPEDTTLVSPAGNYTAQLIITRSDRGVWDECCARLGLDPRDRRVRHVTIGLHGIKAKLAKVPDVVAAWVDGLVP